MAPYIYLYLCLASEMYQFSIFYRITFQTVALTYPRPSTRLFLVDLYSLKVNSHVCISNEQVLMECRPALVLALAYTYAQENRGRKVTIYIITLPVQWLPYAILLMTFVMGGPGAALNQASGLLAAHLYDFLTRIYPTFGEGRNYIRTPQFVRRWFAASRPGPTTRAYGTAYASQRGEPQPAEGSSRGIASGLGSVTGLWNSRGPGRRLGGE